MTALTEILHPSSSLGGIDLRASFAEAGRTINLWRDRASQRRALEKLSSVELEDMGIDASEARLEASKPFWMA